MKETYTVFANRTALFVVGRRKFVSSQSGHRNTYRTWL